MFFLFLTVLKHKKMCRKAVEAVPLWLKRVPDHLKAQWMCERAVENESYNLKFVPDWFVTQQQIKIWHFDAYYCNDGKIIK